MMNSAKAVVAQRAVRVAAHPTQRQVGRFLLKRELGRGAQAQVWLAHDPLLQRDVALKLLDASADAHDLSEWLNEARAVSRLAHPNVVPVFEADDHDGQPYLVFEYVGGPTLAQARRSRPAWPTHEAVALMIGVLDALSAAHEQGIVHRDLKPSNIMLGTDGRPRVMDFGIAARVPDGQSPVDSRIVGTPGYLSPEAARGDAPDPGMDVFSAGVMLAELLGGVPLMQERDPQRYLHRVQTEDLVLGDDVAVDAALRGTVQRALARHASRRFESAGAMLTALKDWLAAQALGPAGLTTAGDVGNGGSGGNGGEGSAIRHATLDFLLRRMRHKTDFPAFSSSVGRILRLAASDSESLQTLADEILNDVALTHKLLRMVNTVHFAAVTGSGIGTVSRAVALVGFAGIRNMALSALLLEHLGDRGQARQLQEEFSRALMCGTLAAEMCVVVRESEEAYLVALLQNLGRLLTEFYFPEEALQIRQKLPDPMTGGAAREQAARQVLGLSLNELGAGVAQAWSLPAGLQQALRRPRTELPPRDLAVGGDKAVERLRWLGCASQALTDVLINHPGVGQEAALQDCAQRYAAALALKPADMLAAVARAQARMADLGSALGLAPNASARLRPTSSVAAAAVTAAAVEDSTLVMPTVGQTPLAAPADAVLVLRTALAAIEKGTTPRAAGGGLKLNEVLHAVLDAIQKAQHFRCVVFALRQPGGGQLCGRIGIGEGAAALSSAMRIKPDANAADDLFALVCAKGADMLVSNARTMSARLPTWYRLNFAAPTFLLLPLVLRGQAIGLIYADKAQSGSINLGEDELTLMRSLRDQAVQALARGT